VPDWLSVIAIVLFSEYLFDLLVTQSYIVIQSVTETLKSDP
jgi:hypothetical protein